MPYWKSKIFKIKEIFKGFKFVNLSEEEEIRLTDEEPSKDPIKLRLIDAIDEIEKLRTYCLQSDNEPHRHYVIFYIYIQFLNLMI